MKRLFPYLIIIALAILLVSSCKKSARDVYAEAVEEWIGKEILFPDSMMTVTGEMIAPPTADFTIVSYYDSTGCTGCRMKLPFWKEFMNKVDSVRGNKSVTVLMIAAADKQTELKHLVRFNHFPGKMISDPEDKINRLNQFPTSTALQTFLIDQDHKVIALGKPVTGTNLSKMYISLIDGEDRDSQQLSYEEEIHEFNFGRITPGEKVVHTFRLHNSSADTLKVREVITSCECTEASVSSTVILPDSDYELKAHFRDTLQGEFFRTISIIFENKKPDIQFELSGVIINK